jgi:DNA-binding transcriptional ArsR family regulator
MRSYLRKAMEQSDRVTGYSRFLVPAVKTKVMKGLKDKRIFLLLAETFQALGDSSRIQIVWALSQGELCVSDVAALTQISQSSVSHHLSKLRTLRLVRSRRSGPTVFYSLDDEHIERLLLEGIEHVGDFL